MIDTKHDSQEDIRKVIELLSGIFRQEKTANVFETPTANNLMGMFDVKEDAEILPTKKEPQIELY